MNYYSTTLKFIKSSRYKKQNPPPFSEFVLLAMAREADKQGNPEPTVQLSDDELLAAVNMEIYFHCQALVSKLFKIWGEQDLSDQNINNYLGLIIKSLDLYGPERIIPFLEKNISYFKSVSKKKLNRVIKEFKSQLIH